MFILFGRWHFGRKSSEEFTEFVGSSELTWPQCRIYFFLKVGIVYFITVDLFLYPNTYPKHFSKP